TNGAHAEIRMADVLAQQGIAVGATLCGRASECAGTAGASRTRGGRGRNAPHAAEKLFWRVRIFWIGLVAPGLSDFGHGAARGFHQIAGDFRKKARGQGSAESLLVAKDAAVTSAGPR